MNVLVAIIGLAVLILFHEAGHFFVARAVGMNPRRFYLGFPPAIVKVTRKGIEYGIGAIPLGGFVKIPGMHRPAASDLDVQFGSAIQEQPQIFPKTSRVKRALERSDLDGARDALPALQAEVDRADLSPAALRSAERGLNELRDGLSRDAYWRQRTWKRVAVIFAGPGVNILLALILSTLAYAIGTKTAAPVVGSVDAMKPATVAGLHTGDRIVAINGVATPRFEDVSRAIRTSNGQNLRVTVLRSGTRETLPPVRAVKDAGHYVLGFRPKLETEKLGIGSAIRQSARDNWTATKLTATFLPRIFTNSGRKDVSSTVGIVDYSSQAVGIEFSFFLQVLGLISLSLALLNLLPLLPLDGGHILFSLIEGVRGRAVGREVYERVSAVGIALFLVLMFIGLSNDIGRLTG